MKVSAADEAHKLQQTKQAEQTTPTKQGGESLLDPTAESERLAKSAKGFLNSVQASSHGIEAKQASRDAQNEHSIQLDLLRRQSERMVKA